MRLEVVGSGDDPKVGRPSGEFDPWDTEKGHSYSPESFYTRSTNKHDHSVDIRFRFPPHLAAMVSELVDSKRFPNLRSIADFYRDAAVHRMHWLNEQIQDGKFEKQLSLEMRLCRVQERKQEMETLQATIAAHADTLEMAWQGRDREVLSEAIAYIEDDIAVMREPYKRQLRDLAATYRAKLKRAGDEEEEEVE